MRVGIASAGVVSPAGTGLAALREALANPDFAPKLELPRPDAPPLPVVACHSFDTKGLLPPLVARRLDRASRLLAVAVREALTAFGEPLPWPREEVGVAMGTWTAGTSPLLEILQAVFQLGPDQAPPMHFPNSVANAPASQVGILEKLGGANVTFFEKQAGGLRAVAEAFRFVRSKRLKACVAGGVDEAEWLNAECFDRLRALRTATRPGFTVGEGAAALVLAPEAPVLVLGAGAAGSPCPPYLYPSTPKGLVAACHRALGDASLAPQDVDLVVSLANGSPQLAALERQALVEVFGTHRPAVLGGPSERLGEGAYSSALRLIVAFLVFAEACPVAWPAPPHLANLGFPALGELAFPPRTALVTALAGGGSAVAVLLGLQR
ncbi:MAG: beta-ketoacyl synthase N-terminal-like domain-containing protein [Thermoanaerobaculum sp.]